MKPIIYSLGAIFLLLVIINTYICTPQAPLPSSSYNISDISLSVNKSPLHIPVHWITIELSKTSFRVNEVTTEIKIPVTEEFYDAIQVGQTLFLFTSTSSEAISDWKLYIESKEIE